MPIMVPDAGDYVGRRRLALTHRTAQGSDRLIASGPCVRSRSLDPSRSDTIRIVLAFPGKLRNPFHHVPRFRRQLGRHAGRNPACSGSCADLQDGCFDDTWEEACGGRRLVDS